MARDFKSRVIVPREDVRIYLIFLIIVKIILIIF